MILTQVCGPMLKRLKQMKLRKRKTPPASQETRMEYSVPEVAKQTDVGSAQNPSDDYGNVIRNSSHELI